MIVDGFSGISKTQQMIEKLTALGFKLISIESGYYDKKTGNLLEVDGVFIKK